jgi:hypothetical protein
VALVFRPMVCPSWYDGVGGSRDSKWMLQSNGLGVPIALQLLVGAAEAISYAGLTAITYQVFLSAAGTPISGPYNCGDAATFYVESGPGLTGVISIPDPDPSILLGDGVTIDQTNSDVISFISYLFSYCGDSSGNPWTIVRSAKRTRFPG